MISNKDKYVFLRGFVSGYIHVNGKLCNNRKEFDMQVDILLETFDELRISFEIGEVNDMFDKELADFANAVVLKCKDLSNGA